MLEEDVAAAHEDQTKRSSFEERDFAQRAGGSGASTTAISRRSSGHLAGSQRPDFNSS